MDTRNIAFVGLKNVVHTFEFELNEQIIYKYPDSIIKKGHLVSKIKLDKKDSFFILNFEIDGKAELLCDRCVELFDYEMIFDFTLVVKFAERETKIGDEEDVIYLSKSDTHIEMSDILYDYITIHIPIQILHPNTKEGLIGCNPEVINKLRLFEPKDVVEKELEDPRWEKLKQLKNNIKE